MARMSSKFKPCETAARPAVAPYLRLTKVRWLAAEVVHNRFRHPDKIVQLACRTNALLASGGDGVAAACALLKMS
jgi:hypothetical protein